MLREIYCEEFHQKHITFHDGLNVVLGSPKADNSIGKSTLMLIVDFAFGGNTYVEASDILQNVGEHSVGFKFCFDGKDYHFLRSITEKNTVWKCDERYTKIESMPTGDYCEWLAKKYGINLYKLTFRDAVGRYIRVYGKDNHDEKHPLNADSSEAGCKASIAILKLFDRYRVVDDLEIRYRDSVENLRTYTQAQAHKFIAKITKTQFEKNEREIVKRENEIRAISAQLDKGLLDLDAAASERAIEIKLQLSHARRMRNRLCSQIDSLDANAEYKFSDTTDTFSELSHFFPNADIQHIREIEQFHKKISGIFHTELQNEKRSLNKQLSEICEVISSLEEQLNGLIKNPNLSKIVLQKHADAVREMDRMATENEAYQKTQDLKNAKKEDEGSLAKVKGEQFGIIEKEINTEMERINNMLYKEKRNAPVLHFTDTNYTFHTPEDTGTGIAFKGLVVFDLAVMHLTKLPILVHDSLILKQISDDAIENILAQYSTCGKQIIIALDKQDSYSAKTASELEEHTVLRLAPGGDELFGRSWSNQTSKG